LISIFFEQNQEGKEVCYDDDFLNRHGLRGQYYALAKEGKEHWKRQLTQNLVVRKELEILGQDLEANHLQVCLLKGFALMGDVYEDWGERFASDVDVLISIQSLWRLRELLQLHGFTEVSEKKWRGNQFKFLFKKNLHGVPVTVEVHTQLFWHSQLNWQSHLIPAQVKGFSRLSNEAQLLHLCGHYGFQHTFIKLFWLVDIFRFLQKYESKIHWPLFWNLALSQRLYRSSYGIFSIIDELSQSDNQEGTGYSDSAPAAFLWSRQWVNRLATPKFLSNPRRYLVRYFLLKTILKDSIVLNGVYWRDWIHHKVTVLIFRTSSLFKKKKVF